MKILMWVIFLVHIISKYCFKLMFFYHLHTARKSDLTYTHIKFRPDVLSRHIASRMNCAALRTVKMSNISKELALCLIYSKSGPRTLNWVSCGLRSHISLFPLKTFELRPPDLDDIKVGRG